MPSPTADLLADLEAQALLGPDQFLQACRLAPAVAGAADLLRELVRRGWLTTWQANRLSKGRAVELVLGNYHLLEPLGEGGMGQVFKARHPLMDRVVALKVVRPELLAHPDALARFRREIQLAARLRHPNIVLAHDAQQADGGERAASVLGFCL